MPEKTYYEILEIAETATSEEIKAAYRRLSHEYHPDKVPSHLSKLKQVAAEKFKQINDAYDVLSNPDKRRRYDLFIKNRRGRQESASNENKPILKVNRTLFQFENVQRKSSVFDSFIVSNEGGGVLNGTITTNKNWLIVSQRNFNIRDRQGIKFHLAAEQGYVDAQLMLGAMYYSGEGVAQDYIEAHKWFNIAGVNGSKEATKMRDEFAKQMTREQIAEAQRLAKEWMEAHTSV